MIVVADAGPLLHLHWVSASAWALPNMTIHVVDEVWLEVQRHASKALADARLNRVSAPPSITTAVSALQLDPAEAAALSYALVERAQEEVLVLCDELKARRGCAALDLSVVGSIGLIVEAHRAGRVALMVARDALLQLPTRGRLHVSSELIRRAVRALEVA